MSMPVHVSLRREMKGSHIFPVVPNLSKYLSSKFSKTIESLFFMYFSKDRKSCMKTQEGYQFQILELNAH